MSKSPIKRVGSNPTSAWERVSTFDPKSLPALPLVYRLRATGPVGTALPVTTKNGSVDSSRILYIGEGENAAVRLRQLIEGLQSGCGGRDEHGVPTKYFTGGNDLKYPFDLLEVQWTRLRSQTKVPPIGSEVEEALAPALQPGQATDEKVMVRVVERGEIFNYEHRVGDLPLFNAKRGYHTKKSPPPPVAPPPGADVELLDPDSAEASDMDPRNKKKLGPT